MAMHGPCHVLTPYCSSEELGLLLFVRKYRKIEFHKNMHSPWKEKERRACGHLDVFMCVSVDGDHVTCGAC